MKLSIAAVSVFQLISNSPIVNANSDSSHRRLRTPTRRRTKPPTRRRTKPPVRRRRTRKPTQQPTKADALMATIGAYPGYKGTDVWPGGTVSVIFNDGDSFELHYDLSGLEANCDSCGIHIHAGLSCDDPSLVLGHYWDSSVVNDLWTADGGAIYCTDSNGSGEGSFNLCNGYGYEENKGHALVIHKLDGTRVGCGILE